MSYHQHICQFFIFLSLPSLLLFNDEYHLIYQWSPQFARQGQVLVRPAAFSAFLVCLDGT